MKKERNHKRRTKEIHKERQHERNTYMKKENIYIYIYIYRQRERTNK